MHSTRMTFLSGLAIRSGLPAQLGLNSLIGEVKNCRSVKKAHMIHNNWKPLIEVDSQTYQVRANGELLTCEPAAVLPMAQRYFLF